MSQLEVLSYTPEIHESLKRFMISQYPNRSPEYIKWWLNDIRSGDKSMWNKVHIVRQDREIVGCMTAKESYIFDNGLKQIFFEANTIIEPNHRNRGIGKLLYQKLGSHSNRCTIGMTKLSYQIQKKKFINTLLDPILVYVIANIYAPFGIIKKFLHVNNSNKIAIFPKEIKYKSCSFCKINSFDNFKDTPNDGLWMHEQIEIPRTTEFLKHRFDDIWRASEYQRYMIEDRCEIVGYAVYRKARIYGLDIITIVDYRCCDPKYETLIFKVANKLAKINRIGFCICLTSRKYSLLSLLPLRIRTPKKIMGVAGTDISSGNILFTAADSDLDFVYYE